MPFDDMNTVQLTKEEISELARMAEHANIEFQRACRDPNITREDFHKLRDQFNDAMRRHHSALGY